MVGRGERGARVVFLAGLPWWEAVSVGEDEDGRPNSEDDQCGKEDHAQNDVVMRNVGGGEEGRGSVLTTVTESARYIDSSHQKP